MEPSTTTKAEPNGPPAPAPREEKRATGSGTGSDNDSLASEVGRLSEENAHLSRKLSEILGKAPATPTSSRSGSGLLSGNTSERMKDQMKRLERENRRLAEQNTSLERRITSGKVSATADEVWRLKEENRSLRSDNAQLASEIEQLNKVASYVGNRVAKVLVGARRANNYNSQLVGELKRWNRRLEDENHRLYNIIDRMQKNGVADVPSDALATIHDRGMDGNAKLVKQLEDQNVKLQEEISKLSDHAISLQNLSSSSGSSGSSGILPAPRTPSNHEQDGPGLRRTLTPDAEPRKVAEKLRDVKAERRKSRNMSIESLATSSEEDVERLRLENKKYAEEIDRIGQDLAFVRSQVTLSKELKDSNAQQTLEIQKLTEAASRVQTLEETNASQAVEIERLIDAQTQLEKEAKTARELKDDNTQMEEDIFKLADEVERLQPYADKALELEAQIEACNREMAALRTSQDSSSEVKRLKQDNVEVQRTLEAMGAEKSVLQAQVRELLEEKAQLQSANMDLDLRVRQLQEKVNESSSLRSELSSMTQLRGQSATYRSQISTLRGQNELQTRKISDLSAQIAMLQASGNSGMARGQQSQEQLEELRSENLRLSEEIAKLRSECEDLGAKLIEAQEDAGEDEELERLREENKELSAKSSQSVLMTVELTTLRNQVADFKKMEEQFEGQQAMMKQLRSEKAVLQKEAGSVPALKADIGALQNQVTRAEHAQKAAEAALASLSSSSLVKHEQLRQQHKERSNELENLQKRSSSVAEELSQREMQLAALQVEYDSLQTRHREQELRSKQSLRKSDSISSEAASLRQALHQEAQRASSASREVAELHSLLQTAKAEREAQECTVSELRGENSELVSRISDLLERNEEMEKTLASVLAKSKSNGHAEPQQTLRASSNGDAGFRPPTPVTFAENPFYPDGEDTTERLASPRRNAEISRGASWRSTSFQSTSPVPQQETPKSGGKTPEPKTPKNGKGLGFGKFFKLSSKKNPSFPPPAGEKAEPAAKKIAATEGPSATEETERLSGLAEEQVMTMYERFVDKDDIDGFMGALGFIGFHGPTAPDDMEGAFASAKYSCRPERHESASDWDRLVAQATLVVLDAWHGAWLVGADN